jgi:hypothetical protein
VADRETTDGAVFRREGEHFLPGPNAISPWGADRLHGGPVLGLLARAVERAESSADRVLARLQVRLANRLPR